MSLRLKIQVPLILLIILISGLLGYISYNNAADSLHEAMVDNLGGEAEALVRAINTTASNAKNDIARSAVRSDVIDFYRGDVHDPASLAALNQALTQLTESYPDFDRFSLMSPQGIVIASSDEKTIGRDFSERNYFKAAMNGEVFLTPPYKSSVTNEAILAVSSPVKVDGNIVGVCMACFPYAICMKKTSLPLWWVKPGTALSLITKA